MKSFESSSEMFFQDGDVQLPHGSGVEPVEVLEDFWADHSELTNFFSLQNNFKLLSCKKEGVVSRLQNIVSLELKAALLHHQVQSTMDHGKYLFLMAL